MYLHNEEFIMIDPTFAVLAYDSSQTVRYDWILVNVMKNPSSRYV